MKKWMIAGISMLAAAALSAPGFTQAAGSPEQASVEAGQPFDLTGALDISGAQPVSAEAGAMDLTGRSPMAGALNRSAMAHFMHFSGTVSKSGSKTLDAAPTPAPTAGAPVKDPNSDLRRRYEESGRRIGQVVGAAAGAAAGAVAGMPSIVGAAAAAALAGYGGYIAGGAIGVAGGYAAAEVKIGVDKIVAGAKQFGQEARQYASALRTWWDERPRFGEQPASQS